MKRGWLTRTTARTGAALALVAPGLALAALAGSLAYGPRLAQLPVLAGAALAVAIAVAIAAGLAGRLGIESIVAGALAALGHAAVVDLSPALAGAIAGVCVWAPRAVRARSMLGAALLAGIAALAGAIAAAVSERYVGPAALDGVAVTALGVAAIIVASPLALVVDDAVGHGLRRAATGASGTIRTRATRSLVLRRRNDAAMSGGLSRDARSRIEDAWREVARSITLRAQSPGPELAILDRRIDLYLRALQRAQRAAVAARALDVGLDDRVLAALELERIDLEARAEALGTME